MTKQKILVVEDEKNILNVIKAYLEKEGYIVTTASDGKKALEFFYSNNFHLIILDLMLPKISGEEVCTTIRKQSNIPIIMLTAKIDEESKIKGLSIGADDYIVKPFSPRELVSRVKALLRRSYKYKNHLPNNLSFNNGDLIINLDQMTVKKDGKAVEFTANEFKLLSVLSSNPGQVFTREQLINKAFGYNYEGYDRTIDSYIKNIRRKIETNSKKPQYIKTVYGIGYKFGGS